MGSLKPSTFDASGTGEMFTKANPITTGRSPCERCSTKWLVIM